MTSSRGIRTTRLQLNRLRLRIAQFLLAALAIQLLTALAWGSPAEPALRDPAVSSLGFDAGRQVGVSPLMSEAIEARPAANAWSASRSVVDQSQIKAAMSELFAGDLALIDQRVQGPHIRGPIAQSDPRSADWRSREAWGAFLIEAQQQVSAKASPDGLRAITLQTVAARHDELQDMTIRVGRPPSHQAAASAPVDATKSIVSQTSQTREKHPISTGRDQQPELRISAYTAELAPFQVFAAPDAPEQEPARAGQLRGSVFIDHDSDGMPSRGDTRMEGHPVLLTRLETGMQAEEHRSASFGQYAFEGLAAGSYALSVSIGWDKVSVSARLNPDDMMQIVEIAVPPDLLSVDRGRPRRPATNPRTS